MVDAFISGVLTLIVLFLLFCGAVVMIEYFPVIGIALLVLFGLIFVTTLMNFFDRGR